MPANSAVTIGMEIALIIDVNPGITIQIIVMDIAPLTKGTSVTIGSITAMIITLLMAPGGIADTTTMIIIVMTMAMVAGTGFTFTMSPSVFSLSTTTSPHISPPAYCGRRDALATARGEISWLVRASLRLTMRVELGTLGTFTN